MGHLINPIAYRLGHSRSWEDSWFVKNIYYPEFLHSMLKIRSYIYYFWTTYLMEKKGIIFSHFNIYKFFKKLLVKIFLYNTDLEKNIYAFYARGVGIFSDSFYYRYKKKKKKKEPFNYERYKPDLFFLFFLYFVYFSRNKVKRKVKIRKAFIYKYKKKNENKANFKYLNLYNKKKEINLNVYFLKNIKEGNMYKFLKKEKKDNEFLKIEAYEKKLNLLNFRKLKIGFLDFFFYIFFKINMLDKRNDDIIHGSGSRRYNEMILNYSLKIKKLIKILKIFLKTKIKIGSEHKRKRSIRNFIFFLIFFLNIIDNIKKRGGKKIIKLRDINLKLIRLFVFHKILTDFAYFYGNFLGHIISILSNINNYQFKFCHITNKSINAKFLARYIGLKLRGKFPLFYVINPIKRELKKLAKKKKRKNSLNRKINTNKLNLNLKNGYKNIITYLFNKYSDISLFYYKKFKTLITFDIFYFFFLLKKNKKYQISMFWKKIFKQSYRKNIWYKKKKLVLNKKWIIFLAYLIKKKNIYKLYYWKKYNLLLKINMYIKNKLLINLFFGYSKYNVDNLYLILSDLKWDINTFFFYNTEYIFLLIYVYFFSYNISNYNIALNNNSNCLFVSSYFFKSYMFYLYVDFSFKRAMEYLNLNRRKYYIKLKNLCKPTSFILGYKMSFKGRFTRKQRASSIWFHQGFVPLNTIKGFIDYSFFTIPLKNSAISIKLWLYKDMNGIIWDNKFLSKK